MLRSIAARIAQALGLILAVMCLNFLLIHITPGDPATVIVGESGAGDPELLEEIRTQYGLDRPVIVQLLSYVGRVATGDLGDSYFFNRSVTSLIAERLWPTVLLVGTALAFAVAAGTMVGVATARRPESPLSHGATVLALVGFSMPVFWTGIMLVILFASTWELLPIQGWHDVNYGEGILANVLDVAEHLVLPALTLGLIYLAQYSRLSRASMLEVLESDYVRTARAKGLGERRVVYKHALRNAVIPVVTVIGLQFGALLSGALLVETVFNWPGLGRLAFDSILRRDTSVLLGVLLVSSVMVIVANLLTDLLYTIIDPRIRLRERSNV
ncbi:MAG: ABC transporter permease [Acidimicrobiales bacterium]|uniref:ABC transporter permease n=1 Tax=Candidatus Poriferisodalis multihospitum TaxID=2983191 RepID=UPI00137FEE39|nr:ABC transporter permease [Candidatus Poriferisodalis multihospitum]MCY3584891.1 ABC transporter permease [Acidimicrobiaceae bacterium]MXY02857.1 ABC transporter permease [Acidimicrobiales bacterium]MYG31213.1 ABC transporter permease [Holophagales bacterium]MCY3609138.1 ABC transporter permease [Acidimicrobiaceae bacterium]MCY3891853.1 ABC transporter permease [Acidimicrobiaceae bacterium]